MSGKLVTIATFDQAAKARLAQNTLTEAGIRAVVADEAVVSMDWLLGAAVGWVKVQVMDEDADRAVEVLEGEFGEDGSGLGPVPTNERALTEEAESEEAEDPDEQQHKSAEPKESPESTIVNLESREEYARRMVFASVLGLLFPPVAFFAMYLFLNAAFGEGQLSSRGRLNLWLGGFMTLTGLCWMSLAFRIYL